MKPNETMAMQPKGKTTIYVGGSLFSGRETAFNMQLAERLERKGYPVVLPQRDGFEFMGLKGSFSRYLRKEEIDEATKNLIYLLDIGKFIPTSKVICANWDEPVDEGLVVEATYGKAMGKFVVGFRTDIRSPFGELSGPFGGMHDFPALQSDVFIRHIMSNRSPAQAESALDGLVGKIDEAISNGRIPARNGVPKYVMDNPYLERVISLADKLFHGMKDVTSASNLPEIASRYEKERRHIEAIRPRVI